MRPLRSCVPPERGTPRSGRRPLAFVFALFSLLFFGSPSTRPRFSDDAPPDILARRLLDAMTDEEALAQTFMLGWEGAEPSPIIMAWIRERNIGGVKIFGRNTDDTRKLAETVGSLQREALAGRFGIPLFVATDQEGGLVRHVRGATSRTPGNMAIGASGYPRDAWLAGYYIARELAALGINMNFAPAVDLYTNRASRLIGPRSFTNNPVHAGILGVAFARGEEAAGIIPTAKHFPGHGDTDLDSHGTLPRISVPVEKLWERELVPYRMLAREGIPAVMSGHLAFPNTPAAETPASLSPWFLGEMLRTRIGFKGLIITDELGMNGATASAGSLSAAVKAALLAGNDVVMLDQTPSLNDPVWTNLAASLRTDAVFQKRVRDAALRVLTVKLSRLRRADTPAFIPDPARVDTELPSHEGAAFFQDLAARSVTVVWGDEAIPLRPEDAGEVLLAGQYNDFFSSGRAAYPGAAPYWYSLTRGIDDFLWFVRRADTVIFCISGSDGLPLVQALRDQGKRVILFSVLSPVHLDAAAWADAAVAVYSDSRESFVAGFSALTGRIPARGRPPAGAPNR